MSSNFSSPATSILWITCIISIAVSLPLCAAETGKRFISFEGFTLEDVTLAEIQKKLGPSKVILTGDASTADARISYAIKGGTIQFASDEMGGCTTVDEFLFTTNTTIKPRSPWPRNLPMPRMYLSGLQPGISKKQFEKVVNCPIQWTGEDGMAIFESKLPMAHSKQYWDVSVTVTGHFQLGRLVEFSISKITSN